MKDKEATGTARAVKGKVQQAVGKVTGDEKTQAHGAAEELKGKVEKETGRLQEKVADVKEEVKRGIHRATPYPKGRSGG